MQLGKVPRLNQKHNRLTLVAVVLRLNPVPSDFVSLAIGLTNYLVLLFSLSFHESAHAWMALLDERDRVRRRWRALFDEAFDVVLMPPFGTAAFEHLAEPDLDRRTLIVDGRHEPYVAQLAWPGVASLAGLPVTVAPIAATPAGLPIGVQIMGPWLEARTTIAFAAALITQRLPLCGDSEMALDANLRPLAAEYTKGGSCLQATPAPRMITCPTWK